MPGAFAMRVADPFLLLCLLAAPALPGREVPDPLIAFNAAFRASYAQAKAARLARGGPVLLVDGDRLALYRDGVRLSNGLIRPPLYHRLKAVAHVPLALQVLAATPGLVARPGELRQLRTLAGAARADLRSWCPAAVLPRQERILAASLTLLDDLQATAGLATGRLAAFGAELGPLLLANAAEAAALELEALHPQVTAIRKALSGPDWQALRVVIIGAHMARDGEIAGLYFSRLLGETREGERIIYAEGLWEPRAALELLATHEVDAGAGASFFGEPMRLHRDLLTDGGLAWLDAHLPLRLGQ
jgi:hypothetical protein